MAVESGLTVGIGQGLAPGYDGAHCSVMKLLILLAKSESLG